MTKQALIKEMVERKIEILTMRVKDLGGHYRKRLIMERDKAAEKVVTLDKEIQNLKDELKILRSK